MSTTWQKQQFFRPDPSKTKNAGNKNALDRSRSKHMMLCFVSEALSSPYAYRWKDAYHIGASRLTMGYNAFGRLANAGKDPTYIKEMNE